MKRTQPDEYRVNGAIVTATTKQEAARRWAEAEYGWAFEHTTARAARMGWYTVHYTNHGASTIHVARIPRGITIR